MFSVMTRFIISVVVFCVWALLIFVNYITNFKGRQSTLSQKFCFILPSVIMLFYMAIESIRLYILL